MHLCRCLGPQQVLEVLPLQLIEGLTGTAEARTWLLPALRKHVSGSQLAYWAQSLLPMAKQMAGLAATASTAGQKSKAAACHALELQLWGCLQSFASWPTDAALVYPTIAPELAAAFHTREDLSGIVASVLVRLCKQARGVAAAAASGVLQASPATKTAIRDLHLVSGSSVPAAQHGEAADGDDDDVTNGKDSADDSDDDDPADLPNQPGSGVRSLGRSGLGSSADEGLDAVASAPQHFTPDVALQQLLALRSFSNKWLGLMCKMFLEVGYMLHDHLLLNMGSAANRSPRKCPQILVVPTLQPVTHTLPGVHPMRLPTAGYCPSACCIGVDVVDVLPLTLVVCSFI